MALFALLVIAAPAIDAPFSGNDFKQYVSAPADTRTDATALLSATLSFAEELEEDDQEEDRDKAASLVAATLLCAPDAEYRGRGAGPSSSPRLAGHSCTGPPIL